MVTQENALMASAFYDQWTDEMLFQQLTSSYPAFSAQMKQLCSWIGMELTARANFFKNAERKTRRLRILWHIRLTNASLSIH
jgi:predicted aminopeptidase